MNLRFFRFQHYSTCFSLLCSRNVSSAACSQEFKLHNYFFWTQELKNRNRDQIKTFKLLPVDNKSMSVIAVEYEGLAEASMEEFRQDLKPREIELKKKTIQTGDEK